MVLARSYLKKAYVWVKNHWYVPIGTLFALVTWFFYRQKSAAIVDNLKQTRAHHKKEIEAISSIHKEQIAERDAAVDSFRDNEERLEAETRKKIEDSIAEHAKRKEEIKKKEIHDIAEELLRISGEREK
jgi:hypothetical protein